ncbi:MAG TPA: YciI family protein [Polyangiales bacterium]
MPKYLCLQRNLPSSATPAQKPSPAQMQAMYDKFNAWREKFQENLVDLGGKLGAGRIAVQDPAPDGPLIEVKELVGGYMVVSAENLDEAIQVARECPGLVGQGSGVEVIEIRSPG